MGSLQHWVNYRGGEVHTAVVGAVIETAGGWQIEAELLLRAEWSAAEEPTRDCPGAAGCFGVPQVEILRAWDSDGEELPRDCWAGLIDRISDDELEGLLRESAEKNAERGPGTRSPMPQFSSKLD